MSKVNSLISVVVPVLNEEEVIESFYSETLKVTQQHPDIEWEFIFIDDGSSDDTFGRLCRLREKDPQIKIIQLSKNFGSYNAICAGFEYARGEAIICISADLQDPPALFHDFLKKWREGYQIVWGVRQKRQDPITKKMLASLFYRLLKYFGFTGFPPQGMDMGLFDRLVIEEFKKVPNRSDITFVTIFWMGFKQAQIPYVRRKRHLGVSKWPFQKRLRSAMDVITQFSEFPIRLISYLGLITSFLSVLGGFIILFNKIFFGLGRLGWPSLMVALLFLGGVQLIMLGIIGEYIWRINIEVRGRPAFIVMNTLGFQSEE